MQAIYDNNLIFLSAQPDTTYFHWQVELYMHQFSQHGIQKQCWAVFGYKGHQPSVYARHLATKYNIVCYKDVSDNDYVPCVRPRLLEKFFKDHPRFGKHVFYHDSDIFLVKMPNFAPMFKTSMAYLSNTISYIGYNYIEECAKRYKEAYPELPDNDLLRKMCEVANIDPELVKANQENSGGAQYLLKNIDSEFWKQVNTTSKDLYKLMKSYERQYPIDHHIQKWTADMWAVLWTYWKRGGETRVHKELDFSWGTSSAKEYFENNIFHYAGVTEETAKDKFYKANYIGKNIFEEYIDNPTIFDHVSETSATYEMVKVITQYADIYRPPESEQIQNVQQFELTSTNPKKPGVGTYTKHETKLCCGKPVWFSDNGKFLIFRSKHVWVLTYSMYEGEIGENCGGICTNSSKEVYLDNWEGEYSSTILQSS
jgi:hypothetical protein